MKTLGVFVTVLSISILVFLEVTPKSVRVDDIDPVGQTSHRDEDIPDYPRVLHLATANTDPGCFQMCTIRYDCTDLGPTDCPSCVGGECMGAQR